MAQRRERGNPEFIKIKRRHAIQQRVNNVLVKLIFIFLRFITRDNFPPFAAAAAVVKQDDQILMIERSDGLGFSLPGGLLQTGETLAQGVIREVEEETGYTVRIERLVGLYSGNHGDDRFASVVAIYVAHVVGGVARSSKEGNVLWLPLARLKEENNGLRLAFDTAQIIEDYESGLLRVFS